MNTKLKPPCKVMYKGLKFSLRALDLPNVRQRRRGIKGVRAKIMGHGGTMIVSYGELKPYEK